MRMQSGWIGRWMAAAVCVLWGVALRGVGAPVGAVELVRDGVAVAEIVCAEDALRIVRLAAEDLQEHLEQMSGARLPIVAAPTPGGTAHIFVGTNAHTLALGYRPAAFGNSGYEVVARGGYVIVAGEDRQRNPSGYLGAEGLEKWHALTGEKFNYGRGGEGTGAFNDPLGIWSNDDCGTWYAVADLLEQLGVRWYMPYEDGTVIPVRRDVRVPFQKHRREAAFGRREFCFYNAMRRDGEGMRWMKRLKLGNNTLIVYNHLTDDIFGPAIQKELHPEYLACDADGKPYGGYPNGHGMPRYTDPDFRRAAALYLIKRFEVMPELTAISMSPPDGGIRMDARDVDRYGEPGDSLEQKTSNYVWDFHLFLARELKKVYPDKLLLYGSGAGGHLIPTNLGEVPDNIVKPFAQPYSAYRVLEEVDRGELEKRRRWHAAIPPVHKAPVWDYFLYYRTVNNPRYPVVFTESLQREMREMLPYSDGKFIEIQPTYMKLPDGRTASRLNTPALIHLMVYWQSRLFWDPDEDREAMLAEYYDLFFGPAAPVMKTYHEVAEEVWCRQESRSVTRTSGFMREADVERFFALLAQAREIAGAGSVYDRRIARIEEELQPLKRQFAAFRRTGPALHVHTPARFGVEFALDGDLEKPFWRRQRYWEWYALREAVTGTLPEKNRTLVSFRRTENPGALMLGIVCHEVAMDRLQARATGSKNRAVAEDDLIEIVLASAERSYFRILVNPLGTVWEECHDPTLVDRDTLPELWNPGIEAVARREADRWSVELRIPTDDFGELGPTASYRWGVNVGRLRRAGGTSEWFALSPTGLPDIGDLSKLGDLASGDVARTRLNEPDRMAGFPAVFLDALKLLEEPRLSEAREAFERLAAQAPTSAARAACLTHAALALARQGEADAALALAARIGEGAEAAYARMLVLSETEQYATLMELFSGEDLEAWPDAFDYRACALRADAFERTGDRVRAAADWALCSRLAGSDRLRKIEAGDRAAQLFRALGESDSALALYRELLDLFASEPAVRSSSRWRFPQVLLGAAALLQERGDSEGALDVLARYGNPEEPGRGDWWCRILETYGDIYNARGERELAATRYRQAAETGAQSGFLRRVKGKLDALAEAPPDADR